MQTPRSTKKRGEGGAPDTGTDFPVARDDDHGDTACPPAAHGD